LATTIRAPHFEQQFRDILDELAIRGKTPDAIDEMVTLVQWAVSVLNPIDGGTTESNGRVYQIVSDFDDLEWAIDIAQQDNRSTADELARFHALLQKHRD
jgi:hypothetical protein